MSSAGVIAHCLADGDGPGTGWVYDTQIGDISDTADARVVWDPLRKRFFCILTSLTGDGSKLISSPDGRPPWRTDHVFVEYTQYSGEPRCLVIHPNGRV